MGRTSKTPEELRVAVLDASLEVLVEHGLQGFTTPLVAARAKVAQGTVYNQFPSKHLLLVATVEAGIAATMTDCAERLVAELGARSPMSDRDLVRLALEVLWSGYNDPRVLAAYEVRAGCRTDYELRSALQPVMAALDSTSGDMVGFLLPETLRVPGDNYRAIAQLITTSMQGRATTRVSFPDAAADALLLESLATLVFERFGVAADEPVPLGDPPSSD